jgi:hypothetical protein
VTRRAVAGLDAVRYRLPSPEGPFIEHATPTPALWVMVLSWIGLGLFIALGIGTILLVAGGAVYLLGAAVHVLGAAVSLLASALMALVEAIVSLVVMIVGLCLGAVVLGALGKSINTRR